VTVGVVVDGGASLPDGAERSRLVVVPMSIRTPEGEVDASVGRDELVRRVHAGVTTAAPSPGEFLEAIEKAEGGDGVVVVTVAAHLSASASAARLAGQLAQAEHEVRVVDSESATAGEGLVALAAARAAAQEAPLEAVVAAARAAAARVRVVAQIAGLSYLARTGRVPAAAVLAARLTGLRPVFSLVRGEVRPMRPAFSSAAGEARVLEHFRRTLRADARLHVAALHAFEPEAADRLLAAVRSLVEPATSFVASLSPVMLAHTGPGVSGLSWWWEEA